MPEDGLFETISRARRIPRTKKGDLKMNKGIDVDVHLDAKALIIAAAKESGLLQEVAELLWFAGRPRAPGTAAPGCPVCELLDRLTDAFDAHVCVANIVAEEFYGEGLDIAPTLVKG
jgi:hypothetical protein